MKRGQCGPSTHTLSSGEKGRCIVITYVAVSLECAKDSV